MKKRFLAIVLTVVMALALAVPSLAAVPLLPTATYSYVVDDHDRNIDQNWKNAALVKVQHATTSGNDVLFGYVTAQGATNVQPKYTAIGNFTADGLAWAKKNDVGVYVNNQGVEVISTGVSTPHDFRYGLARVEDHHGNTFYIDKANNVKFNLGTEEGGEFNEYGLTWVKNYDGKYGIINNQGVVVTHFAYDFIDIRNSDDTRKGVPATESIYGPGDVSALDPDEWYAYWGHDNELYYNSGLVRAQRGNVVDFINPQGAIVFSIDMAAMNLKVVDRFENGMCYVKDNNNQVGYVDVSGYMAAYCQFETGTRYNKYGVAMIQRNGLYGYINKVNAYTTQPLYTWLGDVADNGLAAAQRVVDTAGTLKCGYVNIYTGMEVGSFQYDYAHKFSEGLGQVGVFTETGWLRGYVNSNGVVVCQSRFYDALGDFHSGLAWAMKNGKYGYINQTGTLVITSRYDVDYENLNGVHYDYTNRELWPGYAPYDFHNGLAVVRLADFSGASRYGIINTTGATLHSPMFSSVLFFQPCWNDVIALFQYGGLNNTILTLR